MRSVNDTWALCATVPMLKTLLQAAPRDLRKVLSDVRGINVMVAVPAGRADFLSLALDTLSRRGVLVLGDDGVVH